MCIRDSVFDYEALELPADPGLIVFTMTPALDTPTDERLRLLGSLAATKTQATVAE